MTNDKDSAVLLPCPFCGGEAEVQQQGTNRQSHIIACTNCGCRLETGETWNAGSLWNKRQPTQSDALLEGDAQTILYLLGVRHGREDERAKIAAEASQPTQSDDEAYDLGKRDGYEKAVQDIDMLTGGDGEYCYSTIEGERHCPNVDTMKARIARRLRQFTQSDALREALVDTAMLEALQKDIGTPHLPTQETYQFRMAVSGQGPLAYQWSDKPHRLLYAACRIIESAAALQEQS